MKALIILNTILEDEEYEDMECVSCGFTKTYMQKAISELEVLQGSKQCKCCSLYGLNFGNGYDITYCTKLNIFTSNDFSCSNYESKDNQ